MPFRSDVMRSVSDVERTVISLNGVRVHCFMGQVQKIRTPLAASLANETKCSVGQEVRHISADCLQLSILEQWRIDDLALAREADPVVKSRPWRWIVTHVPFADEARPVTSALQLLRECG